MPDSHTSARPDSPPSERSVKTTSSTKHRMAGMEAKERANEQRIAQLQEIIEEMKKARESRPAEPAPATTPVYVDPSGVPTVPIAHAEAVFKSKEMEAAKNVEVGVAQLQQQAEMEKQRLIVAYEEQLSNQSRAMEQRCLEWERTRHEEKQKMDALESQLAHAALHSQEAQTSLLTTQAHAHSLERTTHGMRQEGQALLEDKHRLEAHAAQLERERGAIPTHQPPAPLPGGPPAFDYPVPIAMPTPPRVAPTDLGPFLQTIAEHLTSKDDFQRREEGIKRMPKFDSKKAKADEATLWLRRLEMAARDDGWFRRNINLSGRLMSMVDDPVVRWIDGEDPGLFWSDRFTEFKAAFVKRFGRPSALAIKDFSSRKQLGDETVRSFGEGLRALALEGGMRLDDVAVKFQFENNLQEPTKSWMKMQSNGVGVNPTFDQLVEKAEQVERSLKDSAMFTALAHIQGPAPVVEQVPVPWIVADRQDHPRQHNGPRHQGGHQGGRAQGAPRYQDRRQPEIRAAQPPAQAPAQAPAPETAGPAPMDIGMARAAIVSRPGMKFPGPGREEGPSAALSRVPEGSGRPLPGPSIWDHMQVTLRGTDFVHSLSDYHHAEIARTVAAYQPGLQPELDKAFNPERDPSKAHPTGPPRRAAQPPIPRRDQGATAPGGYKPPYGSGGASSSRPPAGPVNPSSENTASKGGDHKLGGPKPTDSRAIPESETIPRVN